MPRGLHPNSQKALNENRKKGGFTAENAVERAEKSHEVRRAKRTFREEFEIELAVLIKDKGGNQLTAKNAITKQAVQKALKGDLKAMEFIRDTIGEKPAENVVIHEADPNIILEIEAMVNDTD